jgi:hypothetical protein
MERDSLLHVVPESLSPRDRRIAARNAKKLLDDETRNLAKSIPKGVSIAPVVRIGAAAKEIALFARSTKVDLVVMGRGGGRAADVRVQAPRRRPVPPPRPQHG